jgi:Golgi SNAP receptor complex protein 1
MSQMSVPAGAWEDLRREVRARNPRRRLDHPTRPAPLPVRANASLLRGASRIASRARPPRSRPSLTLAPLARAFPPPPPETSTRGVSQARKLEGEIDGKLSAFAKTASGVSRDVSDGLMLGDGVDAQEGALESLLQRLTDVNAAMAGAVSGGIAGGEARSYTLARHRDVLGEFTSEFKRVRDAVSTSRDRDALLGGASRGSRGGRSASGLSTDGLSDTSQTELLMRERSTVHSSTSAVDDVIGAAQATAAALVSQRGIFGGIASNLSGVGSRFGVMHDVLAAIKRKRSKDTMVLSAVVAFCVAFTLIYWLAK